MIVGVALVMEHVIHVVILVTWWGESMSKHERARSRNIHTESSKALLGVGVCGCQETEQETPSCHFRGRPRCNVKVQGPSTQKHPA